MNEGTIGEAIAELQLGGWRVSETPADERAVWGLWTIGPEEGGYRMSAADLAEVWAFWMMCYREHMAAQQSAALIVSLHEGNEINAAAGIEVWATGARSALPADVERALRAVRTGFDGPGPDWRQDVRKFGALGRPGEHDLQALVRAALARLQQSHLDATLGADRAPGTARRM